jgi:hypothetical protein
LHPKGQENLARVRQTSRFSVAFREAMSWQSLILLDYFLAITVTGFRAATAFGAWKHRGVA